MPDIILRIKGDSKDVVALGEELKKLGKIDDENAKQFEDNNKKFQKGNKENTNTLKETFKGITDIKGQLLDLGKGIAAAFAIESVIAFGKESIAAFQEAELNANKLLSAVKLIGGEGVDAYQKLIDQSEILQGITIFSDDDIQRAQTQLVQFGLNSDQVEKLIPKIIDLASATGTDLGSATDTVIQGVNGLTRGLKPLGLEFKDTGDKAENLAIITEKLNKFTGQAGVIAETSSGKMKILANAWDDFKESVGGFLLDSAESLISVFTDLPHYFNETIKAMISGKSPADEFANSIKSTDEVVKAAGISMTKFSIAQKEMQIRTLENAGVGGPIPKLREELEKLKKSLDDLEHPKDAKNNLGVEDGKPTKILNELELLIKKQGELKKELELQSISGTLNNKTLQEYEDVTTRITDAQRLLKNAIDPTIKAIDSQAESTKNANKKIEEDLQTHLNTLTEKKLTTKEEDEQLIQAGKDTSIEAQTAIAKNQSETLKTLTVERELSAEEAFAIANTMTDGIKTINDAYLNYELTTLNNQLTNKTITQKEYDARVKKAKRDAAEVDKELAMYNIVLTTAQGIMKAILDFPGPAGLIMSAIVGAMGVAEFAIAASTPIPQFAKGTDFLKRGRNKSGIDTIPIMANEGEAIIPTDKNAKYPGMSNAWIKGNLDDYINHRYVIPALKSNRKGIDADEFSSKIAKAIQLNSLFNDTNLLESDRINRKIFIEQNKLLKKIATNSNSNYKF